MQTLYDENQLVATLEENGLCRVYLNNPNELNALTTQMAKGARELSVIIKKTNARVVVFSGKGRAFSAGGDLNYLLSLTKLTKEESSAAMLDFYNSYLTLFTLPLPTISYINGPCVGAGFSLALHSDMRFIVSGTKVGMNFTRIGLNPGMASELHAHGDNSLLIREMLLTGRIYSSSEPRLRPLFNLVASTEEINAALNLTINDILHASPQSIRLTLPYLRKSCTLEELLKAEATGQGICMSTGEIREAVDAQKKGKKFYFTK
ncbi:MAG: putative enoyl-CoA hydratase echA12 [Turneriella sp.]|nr:putative enoyl-CoA hydratase echA12 [Turneriella sp.]